MPRRGASFQRRIPLNLLLSALRAGRAQPGASEAGRFGTWPPGLPGPVCLPPGAPPPDPGIASGGPTFSHLNALRAAMRIEAYGLYAQKWAEKPPGRPRTPCCPIGCYQGRYRAATETPLCLRLLRNRCGGSRISPDGPRVDGCFLPRKKQIHLSRQKGDSRSRTRNPAEIRCPEDLLLQWLRSSKFDRDRLGK